MSAPEAPLRPLPSGTVSEWLQALGSAAESPKARNTETSLWRLREAAAVLLVFDPETLRPVPGDGEFDETARSKFSADLEEIEDQPSAARWKLSNGVRQLALERFKSTQPGETAERLRAALAANPDRVLSPGQKLLEEALKGKVPPLDTLRRDDLIALQSIVSWLAGLVEGLPAPETLAVTAARAELLHPLEQLTGSWFVGREDELARLADHVGVLPITAATGALGSIGQLGRRVIAFAQRTFSRSARPLFVYGVGGIGKSTLLARFLLDHARHPDTPVPFVLLDVDRPSVDPRRPLTFIAEALEQLQFQLERLRSPARELAAHILSRLSYTKTSALEAVGDDRAQFVEQFAELVGPLLAGRPLILVVDTFEEVQFLGPDVERSVFKLLDEMQAQLPQLRVLICGRVPPTSRDTFQFALKELPARDSIELLNSMVLALGEKPPPREFAEETVATVGGNPMILRLVARLVAEEDIEGIRDARARREWLRRARVEALEARLYGRVLGHIHNEKVRKLALPGLVVRRITPEVVLEVLARPCGIEVADLPEARSLVELMEREVALVSRDKTADGLIYRPDIRRVMLETLESTETAQFARQIDENAVAFWSARNGPVARAEEIYHRLRLAQPPEVLDARWDPEAGASLRSALGELEGATKIWLANRLGVSVDEDLRANATQTEWETLAELGALRLLQTGQAAEALELLRERAPRLDHSTLYALETRALYVLDRVTEAGQVALNGLQKLKDKDADAPLIVDLQLLYALTLEKADDLIAARVAAREALSLADEARVGVAALQAQVRVLRLDRRIAPPVVARVAQPPPPREEEAEAYLYWNGRARARELIAVVGLGRIGADAVLLCDTAAEVGDLDVDFLQMAVRQIGIEVFQQVKKKTLREILGRVADLGASRLASVIDGDLREVAKIAVSAVQAALPIDDRDSVRLTVKAFREGSERAVRVTKEEPSEPAEQAPSTPTPTRTFVSPARFAQTVQRQIVDTFTADTLRRLLQVYLSRELDQYVAPSMSFRDQVQSVVNGALAEGWLPNLVAAVNTASGRGQAPGWTAGGELRGHSDVILRVNWHPTGLYLATGSVDHSARIWDVGQLKEVGRLDGHSQGVNQVVWSPDPDTSWIATSSYDKTIRVWSSRDWKCLRTIEGHTADVPDVAWSPDGLLLASASADGSIAIWDRKTGERKATASRGKEFAAHRVLWLDGGQTVASSWDDGSLCLFPMDNFGTKVRSVPGPGGGLIGLAYSQGLALLAGCSSRGVVRVWKYPSLEIVRDMVASTDEVRSISFTANGEFLAANTYGSAGEVHVWSTRGWQESTRFSEPTSEYWPCNISWAPRGYRLASLTEGDKVVRMREMQVLVPVIDRDVGFDDVLKEELRLLLDVDIPGKDAGFSDGLPGWEAERLALRAIDESDVDLSALCLSGGGIRSATFALGLMQGLARFGLLGQFHYLSSVSGGGYIASWLTAWRHGTSDDAIFKQLNESLLTGREPPEIGGIRADSNYLTPQLGLLSADTWTVMALYIRNLLLNWLLFVPFFMGCFMLPRWCAGALSYVASLAHFPGVFYAARLSGAILTTVGLSLSVYGRFCKQGLWLTDSRFRWLALLPLVLSGALFSVAAVAAGTSPNAAVRIPLTLQNLGVGAAWGAVTYLLAWVIGRFSSLRVTDPAEKPIEKIDVAFWTLSGACVGMLATAGMSRIESACSGGDLTSAIRLTVVLGLSGFVLAYLIGELLYVGLASFSRKGDMDREWLARSSGWLSATAVGWTVFSGVALYAPDALQFGWTWLVATATGGVSGLITLVLGSSSLTAATKAEQTVKRVPLARLASGAAIVFALLIAAVLALGNQLLEGFLLNRNYRYLTTLPALDATLMVSLIACALVLSMFININRFSLHALYRNRLVRAFLGSARVGERRPDPFTGFDPKDNLPLAQTQPRVAPNRLFHVINATLNVVSSTNRAWEERKAESFTMTRLFCGNPYVHYRRSETYGGISVGGLSLGTAMAISGAAVSPNQGYNTSPLISFLLMLFNVRLGWWLGNPKRKEYDLEGPRFSLSPALRELTGDTTDGSKWVYLSDGGHFENLGLYEMIRRRCRFIVVSDAGCDPKFAFEDLGNAVRKIFIDFGVSIDFERFDIQARQTPPVPGARFAIGRIRYPGSTRPGWLLYLKPTYQGTERADVRSYATAHPEFPHESTTDQWFRESQLEAYRSLGASIAEHLCSCGEELSPGDRPEPLTFDELREVAASLMAGSKSSSSPREKVRRPMLHT